MVAGGTRVFDKKIRNKLLLRILCAAAAILVALALVTFFVTRSLLAEELKNTSRNKVELVSSRIERWLEKKGEVMKVLGAREGKQPSSAAFKQNYFREIAKRYGGVESAFIGYPDGGFVTGADWTPPKDYDPRKRPWYIEAKARGVITFTTPYRDAFSKRLVTTVAVPMMRDHALVAIMGLDIFIDDLVKTVDSLKIGSTSSAYVVDSKGLYIAHPDAELVLKKDINQTPEASYFLRARTALADAPRDNPAEPRVRSVIFDSADDFILVSRIEAPNWYLFFHLPKSQVNEPLRFLALVFGLGILGALLILAFTVNYISKGIARPILALAEGARHIAEGDYERRLEVPSRDEVGYLTKSFNDMAEGLEEREFIRSTFGRYVSEDVMKDILNGNLELGGQIRQVTILFSDIREFTRISESMEAQELVGLLNKYFTRMDRAITGAGGSINKYLGDGILAMFGAPSRLGNSALAAVNAAVEMMRVELPGLNRERELRLAVGIGIHTGDAVVGNIGSEHRTEYTTIGDTVNTASRIESLTKRYGQALLISQATAEELPSDQWVLRTVDRVRAVGKTIPITLYSPWGGDYIHAERRAHIAAVNEVMELYFASDFAAAIAAIDALDTIDTIDALSKPDRHMEVIRQRCTRFVASPPVDWDGVFTLDSK